MINLNELENIVDMIKIFFITLFTFYIENKIINNQRNSRHKIIIFILLITITILSKIIKNIYGFIYYIICLILLIGLAISKISKNNIGYSILSTTISLSINYVLFLMSVSLNFIPNIIFNIDNNFVSLIIILIIYTILVYRFFKIKRFSKGFSFLQSRLKDEYIDIIILNISMTILLGITLLSNKNILTAKTFTLGLIIFSIIMFITIQKSLQLYYKQQLQQREIEEMKKEIQEKDKEIDKLEKENLSFSKTSHSIAHKQKSLEHKLEQLIMKNETAEEIDIKDRINNLKKEINKNIAVELTKTNITQIDDMLNYMQAECIKNKIDFDLKINGNIHHMTNKFVEKETLEILIADLIKNAIIAINYSKNINKSILVKLGIIDGIYSIYVYDSGIEFEINTLINLGKKPSTTHADSGGTGMGFMNTFDTLNKHNASIEINEIGKESKDNYTKYIAIKFDNKHEFSINSYRKEQIEKLNNNENIILENKK